MRIFFFFYNLEYKEYVWEGNVVRRLGEMLALDNGNELIDFYMFL